MKFLVDENVAPCLKFILEERGHDASCAGLRPDLESEPDEVVLARATEEDRIVVTHDYGDYELLHRHYGELGRSHPGIITCTDQGGYRGFRRFLRWMTNLLATIPPDEFRDRLYYLHTFGP